MRSLRIQPATLAIFLARAVSGGLLLGVACTTQAQVSGNAALTSDYVWRGSSQTREEPAVQAGLKYAHPSGLYASVWGSNVRFKPYNGAHSEFDLAAGWSGKVKTASTMVGLCVWMAFPEIAVLGWIITAVIVITTVYSGVEYFITNWKCLWEDE